jgi:hypothetical protein
VTRQLFERVGDEERIGEGGSTKRSSRVRIRLNDNRGDREQMGVGGKGERNGAKLGRHREPRNGTVREEEMAAGARRG